MERSSPCRLPDSSTVKFKGRLVFCSSCTHAITKRAASWSRAALSQSETKTPCVGRMSRFTLSAATARECESVTIYTGPDEGRKLHETTEIDGGDVLPGFHCKVSEFFA